MGDIAALTHQRIRIAGQVDSRIYGGWTPMKIDGCVAWLAADRLTGFSDDDPISTWTDETSNEYEWTQSTTAEKPLYKTNQQNGLPGVYFDVTDDNLEGELVVTNPCTIFVVYERTSSTGTFRRALSGSNNWLVGPYQTYHQYFNGSWIVGPSIVTGVPVYATVVQKATGGEFWINGVSQGSNSATTAPGTLGLIYGAYTEFLGGHIFEVIVYNVELSTTNRETIQTYLSEKWDIT